MTGREDPTHDQDVVAVPQATLDELMNEVRSLRSRVAALEGSGTAPTTSVEPSAAEASAPEPTRIGRRRAIAGLAGVAAAGTAAALAPASPAAAANGGNVVLGTDVNSASSATGIGVQGSAALYGFGVTDNNASSLHGQSPALFGHAKQTNFQVGVYGQGENQANGVYGEANGNGKGILGLSQGGPAGQFQTNSPTEPAVRLFAFPNLNSPSTVGIEINATNLLYLKPGGRAAPPMDNIAGEVGQVRWTVDGAMWACVTAGSPGTWRRIAGTATAGQLTVLPAPVRVYDSRPGTAPTAIGPKSPFAAGTTRTFNLTANSSGVPAGATAAIVTLLLLNATNAAGNLTIWANGVAKPLSNTVVWGGSAGRFTASAVTALDALAQVQVNASLPTDLVIDVVGYYR